MTTSNPMCAGKRGPEMADTRNDGRPCARCCSAAASAARYAGFTVSFATPCSLARGLKQRMALKVPAGFSMTPASNRSSRTMFCHSGASGARIVSGGTASAKDILRWSAAAASIEGAEHAIFLDFRCRLDEVLQPLTPAVAYSQHWMTPHKACRRPTYVLRLIRGPADCTWAAEGEREMEQTRF